MLFKKIPPLEKFWISKKDVLGYAAMWAVRQSPYPYPENLEIVLESFERMIRDVFSDGPPDVPMHEFTQMELRALIERLLKIPEVLLWNDRMNGRSGMGFVSAFSGPCNPDDDFIDLVALTRNIERDIWRERIRDKEWNDKFEKEQKSIRNKIKYLWEYHIKYRFIKPQKAVDPNET